MLSIVGGFWSAETAPYVEKCETFTTKYVSVVPLTVFVSTVGVGFTTSERLFVSFVGPRGIIPASVATLFAVRLQTETPPSDPSGAHLLLGTVFLTILVTVVIEAGLARQVAGVLGATESEQ